MIITERTNFMAKHELIGPPPPYVRLTQKDQPMPSPQELYDRLLQLEDAIEAQTLRFTRTGKVFDTFLRAGCCPFCGWADSAHGASYYDYCPNCGERLQWFYGRDGWHVPSERKQLHKKG